MKQSLSLRIVAALVLGLLLGPWLGAWASPFGEVAKLVIQVIKAVASPLLFLSIVHAVIRTRISGTAAWRMLGFAMINAALALGIGLSLSNLFQPGSVLKESLPHDGNAAAAAYADKKIDFTKSLLGHIPQDLVTPFATNAVIGIVILALLFGFGFRLARERVAVDANSASASGFATLENLVEALLKVTEIVLGWVIRLVPFAVFLIVAKTVADYGYAPLRGLAWYVLVGLGGLALHIAIVYQGWIVLYSRIGWRRFWRAAKEPVVYAAGANSSLATLPITLGALKKLDVPEGASALGACVGTNLNNDGIILYEGMALLFVAQASGIHLTLGQQLFAALTCLVAAMGVAGVPEAGFISLALVLNTLGLPIELLPLLLTVDWVIARARSVTNVLSDMVLSILIARSLEGSSSLSAQSQPPSGSTT